MHTHYRGRTFNDDIAPIRDYAREQLQDRIKEASKGAMLNVDKIQIVIQSPVIWGTFGPRG